VRFDDPRIHIVRAAGASYRLDELQNDAFSAGSRVVLVPEPDNPHDPKAVAIWDEERRVQAGYVPADIAGGLDADEWQAVVIREYFDEGRRVGLRVLLAPRDAWIGRPRT
jgi:hypothetical protein